MKIYITFLLILSLFITLGHSQDKPMPAKAFKFTPPKSARGEKENTKENKAMKAKSIRQASDLTEEEDVAPQSRGIRRVGVASNVPRTNEAVKKGGTHNPEYNPNLKGSSPIKEASPAKPRKITTIQEAPKNEKTASKTKTTSSSEDK